MNIIMPTFERIEWMPPTITLINELAKQGHNVTYITIYPDDYYKNFDQCRVKNVFLFKNMLLLKKHNNIKPLMGLASRGSLLAKKMISSKLKRILNSYVKEDDILWVVNELTVMYGGYNFLKKYKDRYIFTIYELHMKRKCNIAKAAKDALVTVVPEYNRAHMQKYFFRLSKLPLVLPNKPSTHPTMRHIKIDDEDVRNKINAIVESGKKMVLYMGIITEERPLDTFLEAISRNKDSFHLIAIGRGGSYIEELKSKYFENFTYLGYLVPPQHLQVASWADIGLLTYVGDNNANGLNAMYCAPNKIYEYTGFGMPILANDIPGLYYTVEYNKCGYCVDLDDVEDITNKLQMCMDNYKELSNHAIGFFDSVNVNSIIKDILECYQERLGR